jgi:presenilin-like A22 family membrane protease
MKHNIQITIILLSMFVITQFIGLYVINSDPFHIQTKINGTTATLVNPGLFWLEPPEVQSESDFGISFSSIIFAFIFAIILLFLLIKFKIDIILRTWFFIVVAISLFITFNAIFLKSPLNVFFSNYLFFIIPAIAVSLILSFIKIFKRNFIVHNLTELLIYPGIAVIFVSILFFPQNPGLSMIAILGLLLLISIYDIWAVWHSGIMQKMAKYQINKLRVFSGFFVPYISKKMRLQLKKIKKSKLKNKKIKVNIAILGGGDVIFPIIAAGVILKIKEMNMPFGLHTFTGGFLPAVFVVAGATLGLTLLFLFSEKKKFYPAMPFITAGILLGMILSYLIF